MITIVLIEPSKSGNLGAICRSMKNFGFKNLILINPRCNPRSQTAKKRAKHAQDVLKNLKVKKPSYLKQFDYLVATTAKIGTDYNIPRSPITPEQLSKKITKKKAKIAIVFGRESSGLTNEEVQLCDYVVTIPSAKKYPTLNISHAVNILLYELFKASAKEHVSSHIIPMAKAEKQQLMKMLDQALNKMKFSTKEKKQTQQMVWKRMLGKSMLTKREAYALMGFLRKLV